LIDLNQGKQEYQNEVHSGMVALPAS
jgi:hypothetical protein